MDELATVSVQLRQTRAPVRFDAALRAREEHVLQSTLAIAAVPFVVESLGLAVGDEVHRGDLIARLVSPHAAVREAQERSMLHLLEAQLAEAGRAGELHQAGAERRGAAAQRVEQGRAAVLAASLIAAGVELRSPIDGVIAELAQPLAPPPGQQVVALARVVAIDPLLLELPLPPADALPGVGARVEIFAGGRAREARVRSLAPLVDVAGLMVLLLEVPNADRALAAGLRASGTLAVGARTGAFVPADAIGLTRTGPCVWVASVDGLERRAVRVLADGEDGWVEVWGLAPGERLLADAARAPCCQALE